MPVVLDDSQFDDWMRGTPDQAAALMRPYAGAIEAWEVRAEVGNVWNNRPELMDRVGLLYPRSESEIGAAHRIEQCWAWRSPTGAWASTSIPHR
jgi:hypothetical protein